MEVTTLVRTVGLDLLKPALPQRQLDGHKGTFGKLLIVGGAVGYTGAPYLTASAAARTGCGLVVLGPGLGRSRETARLVWELLKTEKPLVLDADGINALSGHIDLLDARRGRPTVLTPHEVEFARIGGDLSRGDRERAAQDFAMAHGCVLVLKGHRTVTASPEGDVLVNTTGGSGLAKGGSGDVLTGVIASLMAQRADALRAAAVGVWLHGRAGDLAEQELTAYSVTPEDVVRKLPDAIREILE